MSTICHDWILTSPTAIFNWFPVNCTEPDDLNPNVPVVVLSCCPDTSTTVNASNWAWPWFTPKASLGISEPVALTILVEPFAPSKWSKETVFPSTVNAEVGGVKLSAYLAILEDLNSSI